MTGPVGPLAAQTVALNLVTLLSGTTAPNTGGGVAEAIGSFYLQQASPGAGWLKTSAAATGWQQLIQSYAWLSVLDYGADATGAADSTAAFQAAINQANTNGGGVVFVPPGTYAITQLTFNAVVGVQLRGIGDASELLWTWNAASAPGAMITFEGGAGQNVLELLQLNGGSLTNPVTGNHLVQVGIASGTVTETQIVRCKLTNMVTGAGDGVHVLGDSGDLVSRLWVSDCDIDGCARYGVGLEQGYSYIWIGNNYLANCTTEIAIVSTTTGNGTAVIIHDNIINHTSAGTRFALRVEGDATDFLTQSIVANNIILNGFATTQNMQDSVIEGNILTSGAYASTDASWRVFDSCKNVVFAGNLIDRASGASVGPCLEVMKSTTSPAQLRVGSNFLINETDGGNFITAVDVTGITIGNNFGISTNATSAIYGIDVQAVTTTVTDIQVGSGNQLSATTGTMGAMCRLLCNGANITNIQVCANTCDDTAYGARFEIGSGGTFNGMIGYLGNSHTGTTGDYQLVGGATVQPHIGLNVSPKGCNYITGTGSPAGVTTAPIGSLYSNSSGGQGVSVFYKETGTGNTGWIGLGGDPQVWGAGGLTTLASTAVYYAPGWVTTPTTTAIQQAVTRPGTVRNLYVVVETAGVGAATITTTVLKNAATTALAASISNTATGTATDTSDSFTVVAGDLLSIQAMSSGAVASAQANVTATVELA